MKLSASSAQKLEQFFREYLGDENFELPVIHFYTGRAAGMITKIIKVDGITIGRHVLIMPYLLQRNSSEKLRLPEDLVAHEIAHVLQYRREGFIGFLYKYIRDYYKNLRNEDRRDEFAKLRAYRNISFEIEAREIADEFRRWRDE